MIYLNYPPTEPAIDMNEMAFKKMANLRTLIIESDPLTNAPKFSEGHKYLPSSLRVLKWKGFPSESLSSCFSIKASKIISFSNCVYL